MLVLVYVGAVMVLFLFVVMMLDINFDNLRKQFRSYIPVGATVGVLVLVEMALMLVGSRLAVGGRRRRRAGGRQQHPGARARCVYTDYVYPFEIAAVILLVAIIAAIALTHRKRRETEVPESGRAGEGAAARTGCACSTCRPRRTKELTTASRRPGARRRAAADDGTPGSMPWHSFTAPTLSHYLVLGAILFAISMAGIFLNRKNVIILLMAIELMLLAVNMNFIAFSSYLGDMAGRCSCSSS